jgi:hypothetical protein
MRIVELIIDEEAEMYGIDAISIVDRPAIELDFIALKEARLQFAETDTDKRILMGPALVPDKPIYRRNGEDEFYVYFSKSTVRKASELYLKHGNQANHTLEHEHKINGLTVVESWIVENKEKDKSALYEPRRTRRDVDGSCEGRQRGYLAGVGEGRQGQGVLHRGILRGQDEEELRGRDALPWQKLPTPTRR